MQRKVPNAVFVCLLFDRVDDRREESNFERQKNTQLCIKEMSSGLIMVLCFSTSCCNKVMWHHLLSHSDIWCQLVWQAAGGLRRTDQWWTCATLPSQDTICTPCTPSLSTSVSQFPNPPVLDCSDEEEEMRRGDGQGQARSNVICRGGLHHKLVHHHPSSPHQSMIKFSACIIVIMTQIKQWWWWLKRTKKI